MYVYSTPFNSWPILILLACWRTVNKTSAFNSENIAWDLLGAKQVSLTDPWYIVEYHAGVNAPLYNLITGKQTLHNVGVVLPFKEKTMTIDSMLNTLISNPDTRYISKHPSYLLLSITKHLLMIAHTLSKDLITMRKDQQTLLSL